MRNGVIFLRGLFKPLTYILFIIITQDITVVWRKTGFSDQELPNFRLVCNAMCY